MIMNYALATHQNTRGFRLPIDDLKRRDENRKIANRRFLRLETTSFLIYKKIIEISPAKRAKTAS